MPVNTLKEILPQLRDKGTVSRGYLGIQHPQPRPMTQAQAFGLESSGGALVQSGRGGHSGRQGCGSSEHGDVILSVDGVPVKIKTTRELINYVSAIKPPNSTVSLDVWRDGKDAQEAGQAERASGPGRRGGGASEPAGQRRFRHRVAGHRSTRIYRSSLRSVHGIPRRRRRRCPCDQRRLRPARCTSSSLRPGSILSEVNGQPRSRGSRTSRRWSKAAKPKSYLRFYVGEDRPARRGGAAVLRRGAGAVGESVDRYQVNRLTGIGPDLVERPARKGRPSFLLDLGPMAMARIRRQLPCLHPGGGRRGCDP